VVEEHDKADTTAWGISHIRTFPTREAALADAAMMARMYQPRHPMSERDRRIMRSGEDLWIVWVKGATRAFHFRLTVARTEAP
jgi:hypothetical protein